MPIEQALGRQRRRVAPRCVERHLDDTLHFTIFDGYHERLRRFRHSMVAEALDASGGNQAAAARRLGLSRQALSYLVRRLEIG